MHPNRRAQIGMRPIRLRRAVQKKEGKQDYFGKFLRVSLKGQIDKDCSALDLVYIIMLFLSYFAL